MSSGNYQSTVDQEDEFFSYTGTLFSAGDHAARIAAACTLFPRQSEPGTVWVYHTSETYIAGTLMNAWLRAQKGEGQDIYTDLFTANILIPLHFSPAFQATLRTYDEVAQPFAGYGLTLQTDDLARFALFLLDDEGLVNGSQVLDPSQLSAALQRNPSDPGMAVETQSMRYNNAMWATTVLPPGACPEPVWIPFMSGYGGISVAMLPNGSVYYVFSDGAQFKWAEAAIESHKLKSFCEAKAS
jgi:CubicO group peptidase (beta-lactamase class C family)